MYKRIYILIITLFVISCNNNQKTKISNDNFELTIDSSNYVYYKKHFLNLFEFVKKNQPSDTFFISLQKEKSFPLSSSLIYSGSFFNDTNIENSVILYFLKIYKNNLNGNSYGSNYSCCIDENIYNFTFYFIYHKISNRDPLNPLKPKDVFEWTKQQSKFLENQDIKTVVDSIEIKLKNKN